MIGSADLKIELFDVLLQSEYVWRYVEYLEPSLLNEIDVVVVNAVPVSDSVLYYPDYIAHGYYVLLGWDLPLRQWLGQVHVTPYVMYESNLNHPTIKMSNLDIAVLGVNVKPLPSVSLKVEGELIFLPERMYGETTNKHISAQLAVFF